jgi:ATP-dependent RNA helicase SUPV3L1/SUV3
MSEKAYAEMQAQWKKVIQQAGQRLHAAQKASMERRQTLIAQARELASQSALRIDAVKTLQQQWQQEAQAVPLDRKTEQKLWDAFRAPIDEAFQRKGQERQHQAASMSERDRAVLEASKALDAANALGDASKIRQAMAGLDAALRGQAAIVAPAPEPASSPAAPLTASDEPSLPEGSSDVPASDQPAVDSKPAKSAPRPVVAVRGDDRPGARRAEPSPPPGRREARPGAPTRNGERGMRPDRYQDRPARFDERDERGPRLADAAFRAQREARERAELALRKLAAQAHGETLTQLLLAWQSRHPEQVPPAQSLGKSVNAATRQAWVHALSGQPAAEASTALLRLEMAAEAPTPAEHMAARRALQLQLLTRRNEPGPRETWGQDVAAVLAGAHNEMAARRLTGALRHLLRA